MITGSEKKRGKLFLVGLIVLFSCTKQNGEYYYAHCYEMDSVPSDYWIAKIVYENGYRTDITYSTMGEDSLKQIDKKKFFLVNGGLNRVITKGDASIVKPYLTTLDSGCIEFLFENEMDDVLATTLCFLGKEDVIIGDKKYRDAYMFRKKKGSIESRAYYDSDFILLKEEYVSGYTAEYRINRLDTVIKALH